MLHNVSNITESHTWIFFFHLIYSDCSSIYIYICWYRVLITVNFHFFFGFNWWCIINYLLSIDNTSFELFTIFHISTLSWNALTLDFAYMHYKVNLQFIFIHLLRFGTGNALYTYVFTTAVLYSALFYTNRGPYTIHHCLNVSLKHRTWFFVIFTSALRLDSMESSRQKRNQENLLVIVLQRADSSI